MLEKAEEAFQTAMRFVSSVDMSQHIWAGFINYNLARVYTAGGDVEQAVEYFRKAVRIIVPIVLFPLSEARSVHVRLKISEMKLYRSLLQDTKRSFSREYTFHPMGRILKIIILPCWMS